MPATSNSACAIDQIVIALELALAEPESMYRKTKNSKHLLKYCKACFPDLLSRETRTVYSCFKALLGKYVKTLEDAQRTLPLFRKLIPSLFKQGSFGAIPLHYFQMRRLFEFHRNDDVSYYADDLFRKTRDEIRQYKKNKTVVVNTNTD